MFRQKKFQCLTCYTAKHRNLDTPNNDPQMCGNMFIGKIGILFERSFSLYFSPTPILEVDTV